MSQAQLVNEFIAITGSDEPKAKMFLQNANWNLELAISNLFDAPDSVLQPQVVQQPSLPSQQVPSSVVQLEDDPLEAKCGLFDKHAKRRVPLKGIACKAAVRDLVAEVEIAQRFQNELEGNIEAVFQFRQLEATVSSKLLLLVTLQIYSFVVEINGEIITGVCKEKQSAFEKYDDSVASGHGAFLLEQGETEDSMQINVGNLPPHTECALIIKYVTELTMEGEAVRFSLPITSTDVISASNEEPSQLKTLIPNGITIDATVEMASEIIAIESQSHMIDCNVEGQKATLRFNDTGSNHQRREFSSEILIATKDPHKVTSVIETTEEATDQAIMVTFYPKIEAEDDVITEIIFLVDRSGSMAGSRLNQAKNALQLFLRSLPEGTLFNIVGFGSSYQKLFPSSVLYLAECHTNMFIVDRYSSETLTAATQHVISMQANLAGTEILGPLSDIFSTKPSPKYPRIIFCVTDGEVKNTKEVIDLVRDSAETTRVFTLGIGADASRYLVRGMAQAGKGYAEFAVSGERLEAKVLRQLKRALQPVIKETSIDWGSVKVKQQSPQPMPPIFDGERVIIYAMVDGALDPSTKAQITLKASTGNKEIVFQAPVEGRSNPSSLVHRLTARSLIRDLEKKDRQESKKAEIVPLALKYGLISRYTSIVAIEKRDVAVEGNLVSIPVNEAILDERTSTSNLMPSSSLFDMEFSGPGTERSQNQQAQFYAQSKKMSAGPLDLLGGFGSAMSATVNQISTGANQLKSSVTDFFSDLMATEPDAKPAPSSGEVSKRKRSSSLSKEKKKETEVKDVLFNEEEDVHFDGTQHSLFAPPPAPEPAQASSDMFFSAIPVQLAKPPVIHLPLNDPNMRPLDKVILLQQSNGSWKLSDDILRLLDTTKEAIVGKLLQPNEEVINVLVTALAVIRILCGNIHLKFSELKMEWEMLCEKATKWIKKECTKLNINEPLIWEAAKSLVK